ncbi:GIY-YIG nuclease family protein [Atopobacter sp. AH10]|uniref:GIY-YIG nuclease family protein n=1 Tax=Atopobacter sp. AH10 TaxID=2315861 RepID=UPI000EF267B2|nr:GIY-YIG nuclease family protein [Atopobacter sp. AH10]RLK62770.1 GIY-YIG nuclease family protein [Atopobacter sp. AH10]
MEAYVYVLECADGTLYTGYTNRLEERVERHNAGKGAKYTRIRRPVRLVWAKKWPNKSLAMKAEYAFKQLKRPEKEKYLAQYGIHFPLAQSHSALIVEASKSEVQALTVTSEKRNNASIEADE